MNAGGLRRTLMYHNNAVHRRPFRSSGLSRELPYERGSSVDPIAHSAAAMCSKRTELHRPRPARYKPLACINDPHRPLCTSMAWRRSGVRIPIAPPTYSVARWRYRRRLRKIDNVRNTSEIGNRTEGIVLAALLQAGYRPLLPFGDGHPYDIAFDDGGKLSRAQCKTGRLIRGAVVGAILVPLEHVLLLA